ncbi:MAG: molecular chaperone DnaJ, partial [Candidatus Omnitrophica bacterium]|nr:molecular chaperone DnaJ [Candidatus Omnitrophota bacterium]
QYGHAGFDQRYSTEDIFRGADFSSIFGDLGGAGGIFEQLFGGAFDLFGGRSGGGGRGADLEYELELSFEEAARGLTKTVHIPRREMCSDCRGQGGERTECGTCRGTGQIRQSAGFMVIARTCHKCGGQGSALKKACAHCRGEGRVEVERKIEVTIPAGIEDGMRLRLSGEGEGGTRARGNLYVLVRVADHPLFRREGPHLILDYPVNFAQAALGIEVEIPSLNGRVSMKIPAGTQSGTVLRVRGKGLADVHDGRMGDLLVRVLVETPTNLTSRQRHVLEEFTKTFGDNAHPKHQSFVEQFSRWMKGR